jgi:hypothetical protein
MPGTSTRRPSAKQITNQRNAKKAMLIFQEKKAQGMTLKKAWAQVKGRKSAAKKPARKSAAKKASRKSAAKKASRKSSCPRGKKLVVIKSQGVSFCARKSSKKGRKSGKTSRK